MMNISVEYGHGSIDELCTPFYENRANGRV